MMISRATVGSTTLVLMCIARLAGSQALVPVGVQGQVNTYTTSDQLRPSVAYDGDGDFVVVWGSVGSSGTDNSRGSIQGRAFNSKGVPAGFDTQVNTYTTADQWWADVAADDDGHFVVVWASEDWFDGYYLYSDIKGQRYGPDGQRIGGEFRVNTYTTGDQDHPAVAMNADGAFIVVWDSYGSFGSDTSMDSIQGQRFDAEGSPLGGQFQINNYTTSTQTHPAVDMDDAGAFAVVWCSWGSYGTDSSSSSIQGRIYNSNGVAVGPEAQVNTYTTSGQEYPEVAVRADGVFAVAWQSDGSEGNDDSSFSIQGRVYNSNGLPFGPETQVNTYTTGKQAYPDVAADREGNFVVVWHSEGSSGNDTSETSIQGRLYAANGLPAGPDFQINTYTSNRQYFPSVGVDPRGRGAVVWESKGSSGSDTAGSSIQGQRFALPFVFADGFESGNTSLWSSTAP